VKKKISIYIIVVVVVVIVSIIGIVTTVAAPRYGIVKGKIADELSGDPVRGVRIVVDGRSTTLYQTTRYKLTKIPPGEYTLEASPPSGWIKFTRAIKVKQGVNVLDISLKGDKIPDLSGIICFTESKKDGITVEIRYTDSKGIGMTEFPQLPIKVDVTLWERVGEKENYKKGEKLFEGEINHFWDSRAYLAKNKGFLSWDKIPVKFEDEKYGIMEVRIHLEQGEFKDTIDDVKLFPEKEEKL